MLDLPFIPKLLKDSLKNGGDFSELYYELTTQTNIVFEDKRLDEIVTGADQGVGLRVFDRHKSVYGYSNDAGKKSLSDLAGHLSAALKGGPATCHERSRVNKKIGLKKQEPNAVFPLIHDPQVVSTAEKIKLCEQASRLAWGIDPKVRQVQISYNECRKKSQIANSSGEFADHSQQRVRLIAAITVGSGDNIYTSIDALSGHCGFELLSTEAVEELVRKTTQCALLNLTAKQAPGGRMAVVLSSTAGGTIIHEAVGHGLEADIVSDGMSVYQGKIGQRVASPLVTIVDDATLAGKNGSFSFDDEGIPSQRTVLIENGMLKNYMCDRLSALKLGLKPTGNGRRESYEYRPIVRMTNTILLPGKEDPEAIIRSVDKGLFVKKMGGGQVNTVNGDFVFEVTEGYRLENGKIGEPIKNASLVGSGPDILHSIDRVGNDQGFSVGTCGKDGQSVPVSDAIPTIRIPEITVGGKVG